MDWEQKINQDPKGLLKNIRCFALDMDGTLYLGNRMIDGADRFLDTIQSSGRRFSYLTNNSSKNAESYLEKLQGMGLGARAEDLVTSGHATIHYLQNHYPGQRVYLLGNPLLQQEFTNAGIQLDDEDPEVVVTAYDTTLDYAKLCLVCDHLRRGLPFIATHPDINCPTENGFAPDIGSFHALIEASMGRTPDVIVGKPNRQIIDYMLDGTGISETQTAMVGDRLYTDIALGQNADVTTILVLSGESTLDDLDTSPVKPDLIFSSVAEIIPFL